jgi:hypothetical protein
MASNKQSGVDSDDFTGTVNYDAVAGTHVTLLVEVLNHVVLSPAARYERSGIVWDFILCVDRTLEDSTILIYGVFRERGNRDPLASIQIRIPDI